VVFQFDHVCFRPVEQVIVRMPATDIAAHLPGILILSFVDRPDQARVDLRRVWQHEAANVGNKSRDNVLLNIEW
jgi:hypothetical protein